MSDLAAAMTDPTRPQIQQINFNPEGLEIVYVEPRDIDIAQRTGIGNTRVKQIPFRHIESELLDLLDSCSAILDAVGAIERDAPSAYRRPV